MKEFCLSVCASTERAGAAITGPNLHLAKATLFCGEGSGGMKKGGWDRTRKVTAMVCIKRDKS